MDVVDNSSSTDTNKLHKRRPLWTEKGALLAAKLRIEHITQAIAQQIEAQDCNHDGETGEENHVRCGKDVIARFGEHLAPFRGGGLRAEPQESQRGASRTALPMPSAPWTIKGVKLLGRIWSKIMRR